MVTIKSYEHEDITEVIEFNKRLFDGRIKSRFPESPTSKWLPETNGREIYQELFLAKEDEKIRGCYILKHQKFFIKGRTFKIAQYTLPISEGVIIRRYMTLGIKLLFDALKRQPKLFALGMGGFSEPVVKQLELANWPMYSVPFYFKVVHPFRFLRNINFLRKKTINRIILDLLAFTGVGVFGLYLLKYFNEIRYAREKSVVYEKIATFDKWADELWGGAKRDYMLVAVRDVETLNILYPSNSPRFIKLLIKKDDAVVGWAVVLDTQMDGHKQFGDMRLGSIIDGFAAPENASEVISSASRYLEERGVDLIVANHSHKTWGSAFREDGFLNGPSNFIFAASKDLAKLISPFMENVDQTFLCRGDGDGPINL